ncbi:MAG: alginate O-acetyltransferase AlgX-related protein [Pseudomonadota bacterium]
MGAPPEERRKRLLFWAIFSLLLAGVALASAEAVASFLVPSYPARDIRPITVTSSGDIVYNDWALRDRPRTFARPPGVTFRSVLVGDSFLEGHFLPTTLPALIEKRWTDEGHRHREAINFGVSATGPRQYYYRIDDVALDLKPDAIVLAIYAGNDFVSVPFGGWIPPLIAELPLPSVVGTVAPRSTWFTVNRLGLSEIGRNNQRIAGELEMLNAWRDLPPSELVDRIVAHVKRYYYPQLPEARIREIFARGDNRFATAFVDRSQGREMLPGWLLNGMVDWETGTWRMVHTPEEADRFEGGNMIAETLTWIEATERLTRRNGIKLIVALLPVGIVDPDYMAFWRFWPNYLGASLGADARHRRLAKELRQRALPVVDLRETFDGLRGTYRLTDGHWTMKGTEIAADRLSRALAALDAR